MRVALGLLVLASCRREEVSAIVDASPPAPEAAAEVSVRSAPSLARHVVTDADYARRVLYTWTTPAQIAALRTDNRLLVATSYAGSGPSRFILDLEDLVHTKGKGADIARTVLLDPALSRRRYAWPSPFATRMGLSGKSYGNALIRVVLKEGSLVARFHPEEANPWSFVDLDNRPAPFDATRLGAVFHVRSSKTATAPFREYVLCNEAQIASYSIGTEVIRKELEEERDLLRALAGSIERERETWKQIVAFDNERYQPTRENLEAIVTSLEGYDPTPPTLERP